jgi:hypothetical protein
MTATISLADAWHTRLQTGLLVVSILALGFAIGVHWFATATFLSLDPLTLRANASLETLYHQLVYAGLSVFAAASVGVVLFETTITAEAEATK